MKKVLIIAIMICSVVFMQAQTNSQTLGLRLGGGSVSGAEISYQHGLSMDTRLEWDLGFGSGSNSDRVFFAGIYHWVFNIEEALNWYIGPGAGAGFYNYDNADDGINVAVGGQIGLEYDFSKMNDVPLALSLDVRPMFDLLGDNSGLGWGVALGVRYIF